MTSSPFSPARVAVSETFPLREIVSVQIRAGRGRVHRHANPGFGSHNPDRTIIVVKYQESAPGHSSRRVSGRLPGVVQRFTPLALRLPALFPETGGTFLRGLLNSFGPFEAARRFLCTLRQLRQEARGVLTVLFGLAPSCALVHVEQHERRRLQCPTKVLKEPTK